MIDVLFEDNHVLVINKKPSDLVQGDKSGDEPLTEKAKLYLKEKYQKPGNVFIGLVHRLDRPTSGALVLARTSKALSRLNIQFRDKETNKVYWALVENKPEKPSGTLINYLVKNEKQNKSYVHNQEVKDSKKAILHYTLLASSDKYHLLEIELETGRHHQIRAQLAHIGCTIKGDLKYGSKRSNPDGSIHLHARKLTFNHPTQNTPITVIAPVPNETLWNWAENTVK